MGFLVLALASSMAMGEIAKSAEDAKPLSVGDKAPKVKLVAMDGTTTSLKKVLAKGPTVLVFYRGGWCPYCNAHLSDLERVAPKLKEMGYQVVAVSPDLPVELGKMATKDSLGYELYSDSSTDAMQGFGVAYKLADDTYSMMKGKYGVDLETYSGKPHHVLPVPSVFLLDKKGKILFVHADPNYKVRMSGDEVLAAAKSAMSSGR